jgi:hypothetical protein
VSIPGNNYPNLDQLSELCRVSTSSGHMNDIFSNPIYKEAEEYDLSLITNDIDEIHNAVNSYTRLRFNLNIRTQLELPRLIKDAQDIIQLLKEEYGF